MKKLNNNLSTLIECSPNKNIIYSMPEFEAKLICNMLEAYRLLNGRYPKIQDMIDFIKDRPEVYGNQLFNNVKIEKKKLEKVKGKTAHYCFIDDDDLYDSIAENGSNVYCNK